MQAKTYLKRSSNDTLINWSTFNFCIVFLIGTKSRQTATNYALMNFKV